MLSSILLAHGPVKDFCPSAVNNTNTLKKYKEMITTIFTCKFAVIVEH